MKIHDSHSEDICTPATGKKKKRHAHARPSEDIVSTLCSLSQIVLVSELLVISVSPLNLNPYNETKFGKNPLKPKDSGVPE